MRKDDYEVGELVHFCNNTFATRYSQLFEWETKKLFIWIENNEMLQSLKELTFTLIENSNQLHLDHESKAAILLLNEENRIEQMTYANKQNEILRATTYRYDEKENLNTLIVRDYQNIILYSLDLIWEKQESNTLPLIF